MKPRPLTLRTWRYSVGAVMFLAASLIAPGRAVGQTRQYTVTELSSDDAPGVPCKLNDFGDIAGRTGSGLDGKLRATIWDRSKFKAKHIDASLSGDYSSASNVNDAGEVVGVSNTGSAVVPFLWTVKGDPTRIPLLRGDTCGQATAINNSGEVVGSSKGPGGTRAFVWSREGGMQELGILPGRDSSRAMDINDSGEVVGSSANGMGERAFIWTKQVGIADLNSPASAALGFVFIEAHAINARGQIIVMGQSAHESIMATAAAKDDHICAPAPPSSFLLTPVLSPIR